MSFEHARLFDTCWGLGLARITIDEETDANVLILTLWPPVCDDGSEGEVTMALGCSGVAYVSDETADLWDESCKTMLAEMTIEKFEKAFDLAGLGNMLDQVCGLG